MEPYDVIVNQPVVIDNVSTATEIINKFIEKNHMNHQPPKK